MPGANIETAILADIHSNYEAFKTCVEEAERKNIHDYIFLGDYLGDLACPKKTLSLIKKLKNKYHCIFIRGNKEDYWINHRKNKDEVWESGKSGTGMLCYNYENLTDDDIDFDYNDELTAKLPAKLTICGHFHYRADYTKHGNRVINPGSVGVALGTGGGRAEFMILRGINGSWEPEFFSLPYDVEKAIADMDKEELYIKAPCWYRVTKHIIREGMDSFVQVLTKAHTLYLEETGGDVWQDIPEEYWERALKKFGI